MTSLAILLMTLGLEPAPAPAPASEPTTTTSLIASPEVEPTEPTPPTSGDPSVETTEPEPEPEPSPTPDEIEEGPPPDSTPPPTEDVVDAPPPARGPSGETEDGKDKAGETKDGEKKAGETKDGKKKLSWSIGGRIMGGWEVQQKRPIDMPAETEQEPFLRQARVKFRVDYGKRFKIRTSIDLADAIRAPNFDRVSYLRNAYGQVRFHDAARLRFGYFKRPFSRLELRGPGDLPFRGRGLANGQIIEDRNYGDRSVGTMLWGRIAPARLTWYAGAFAPALRTKGVDAVGRVQADPLEWLSLGVNGVYKRVENGIGETVDVGSFGADFRLRYKGLYFLGDLVMGQDYLVPGEPFALGLVGYVSYDIDLPKKLILQPVVLTEWVDNNIEVSQNDAIRSVVGVNLLWRKRFRVMPQVELIRPRGLIDNPWTNKDTYYVMLSLEL